MYKDFRTVIKNESDAMMELVTIVVPVYNSQKYLSACIESILSQTYRNFELLLSDDGSDDSSLAICCSYEKVDKRIKLIKNHHRGTQAARKIGIEKAQGKWITFIDSDDEVTEDYLEFLVSKIEGFDYATTACRWVGLNGENEIRRDALPEGEYDTPEKMEYLMKHAIVFGDDWSESGILPHMAGKIFRTELAQKVIKEVSVNISYGEDMDFTTRCLLEAKKITLSEEVKYVYYQRENSTVNMKNPSFLRDIAELFTSLTERFSKCALKDDLQLQLQKYILAKLSLMPYAMEWIPEKPPKPLYACSYLKGIEGEKIVLYGAGVIGDSIYHEIRMQERYKLVAWVDKNYSNMQDVMPKISSPDSLMDLDFDVIIIGVGEKYKDEVIRELFKKGIPKEKMIWKEMVRIK